MNMTFLLALVFAKSERRSLVGVVDVHKYDTNLIDELSDIQFQIDSIGHSWLIPDEWSESTDDPFTRKRITVND